MWVCIGCGTVPTDADMGGEAVARGSGHLPRQQTPNPVGDSAYVLHDKGNGRGSDCDVVG